MAIEKTTPPDATLLIAPGCPHCPRVLQSLSEFVKSGEIGSLEVINIAIHPEAAEKAGTRSVPWTKVGSFELVGALTPQEIRETIEKAGRADPVDHLVHLLETSRLDEVVKAISDNPDTLPSLVTLLGDLDTPMAVRIGIGALLEELPETLVRSAETSLISLTASDNQSVRADAAHYLSLIDTDRSRETLKRLLNDSSDEVREIAGESLEALSA
ncbi:MAG: HEAT repeat domain-containing protein [Sedimenticolaceae bacterium]|nr:HEAT repeat domain-containing protein [Sedimenticolaceae bacterium]